MSIAYRYTTLFNRIKVWKNALQCRCSLIGNLYFISRVDDGEPIWNFAGLQEQPHRHVVERSGRRRGTKSKTIRGTRRNYIPVLKYCIFSSPLSTFYYIMILCRTFVFPAKVEKVLMSKSVIRKNIVGIEIYFMFCFWTCSTTSDDILMFCVLPLRFYNIYYILFSCAFFNFELSVCICKNI